MAEHSKPQSSKLQRLSSVVIKSESPLPWSFPSESSSTEKRQDALTVPIVHLSSGIQSPATVERDLGARSQTQLEQMCPEVHAGHSPGKASTKPMRKTKTTSTTMPTANSSESSGESSDSSSHSSRSPTPEIPACDIELEALWQTLKTGFRSLENVRLSAQAMVITARRATDKVEAQNNFVRNEGCRQTVAEFRAGRYLRRTRRLLKKVEGMMDMMVEEEPKILHALCTEKKRFRQFNRTGKRASRRF